MTELQMIALRDCRRLVGSAPPFAGLLPALHAILATGTGVFPVVWDTEDAPTAAMQYAANPQALDWQSVWDTPYYLLHTLLGWSDPALGLLWWYRAGLPELGDRRLAVLKAIYLGRKPLLDYLAVWLWVCGDSSPYDYHWQLSQRLQFAGPRPPDCIWEPEPHWLDGFRRRHGLDASYQPIPGHTALDGVPAQAPFIGGTNALHLPHLLNGYGGSTTSETLSSAFAVETRQAHVVLSHFRGWHRALHAFGSGLPPLDPGRSWHIHVTVADIGHLGVFRQSRVTGLYFQGSHNVHLRGNSVRT